MSSLYLTGLFLDKQIKTKNKNRNKIRVIPLKENPTNYIVEKNKSNLNKIKKDSFKSKKLEELSLNNSEENFINFIMNEETRFADLDKIEVFYNDSIKDNIKIHNEYNTIQQNKKSEFQTINFLIEKELLENIEFDLNFSKSNYERQKINLKNEIENKKHDLDGLENIKIGLTKEKVNFFY